MYFFIKCHIYKKLDLGLNDTDRSRFAKSPDGTMTESTRERLKRYRSNKVGLNLVLL
jgi:hypothetical protein